MEGTAKRLATGLEILGFERWGFDSSTLLHGPIFQRNGCLAFTQATEGSTPPGIKCSSSIVGDAGPL